MVKHTRTDVPILFASEQLLERSYLVQAPKPSPGPHKQRECLPLILILRNRLKYVGEGCLVHPLAQVAHTDHELGDRA